MRRERDRRTQTRSADPFAALVASLSPRVWLDAHGGAYLSTTGALVDAAVNRVNGSLNAVQVGAARPSYDAAAFGGRGGIAFAGAHSLSTPVFSMGVRSSGCGVWRVDVTNSGLCEFGAFNTHSYAYHAGGTPHRVACGGGGEAQGAGALSATLRVVWRMSPGGVRALFNGAQATALGIPATPAAATDSLYVGALSRGTILGLRGAVGELVFADAVWTDAQMNAVDAAMAAKWGL